MVTGWVDRNELYHFDSEAFLWEASDKVDRAYAALYTVQHLLAEQGRSLDGGFPQARIVAGSSPDKSCLERVSEPQVAEVRAKTCGAPIARRCPNTGVLTIPTLLIVVRPMDIGSLPPVNTTVSVPAENALMARCLIDEGFALPISVKEPPGPS